MQQLVATVMERGGKNEVGASGVGQAYSDIGKNLLDVTQ